ncbi:hypothetical protein BDW66DRAFT_153859 [Aspergillus desertorum]
MSFFKELTKEFKELKASLSGYDASHDSGYGSGYGYGANPNYAPPGPGYPSQHQQQPVSSPPPSGPPLPPGWVAQFDHASQRWYYIEQATGISRWEPPAYPAPYGQYGQPQVPQYAGAPVYPSPGQYPGHGQQGHDRGYNPGYDPAGGYAPGYDYSQGGEHYSGEKSGKNKSKDDKKNMLLAGAGDDSDDETRAAAAAVSAPSAATALPPVGLPPDETADGDSLSSSDREEVLEARQEYERAQLAAQDSDASSSEEEALDEAREEYEEVYEEVYDD